MMKSMKTAALLVLAAALIVFQASCDDSSDDSTDNGSQNGGNGDPAAVLNEDFSDWGDDTLYMAKPDGGSGTFSDNGTVTSIGGHDSCLVVHDTAVDNNGYGFSVEIQLPLDEQTDMTGEDYTVTFDIYIPAATYNKGANVQFGFYETENFTPIYSLWYSGSLVSDDWVTISAPVSTVAATDDGDLIIDYSGFAENPGDWVFDAFRINCIINGTDAAEGDEILFYVDNIIVTKTAE